VVIVVVVVMMMVVVMMTLVMVVMVPSPVMVMVVVISQPRVAGGRGLGTLRFLGLEQGERVRDRFEEVPVCRGRLDLRRRRRRCGLRAVHGSQSGRRPEQTGYPLIHDAPLKCVDVPSRAR